MLKLSDFDYDLPKELIAQYPSKNRDESRLLVLDRDRCKIEHRIFKDIVEYFGPGDLLVLNDAKVVPARLKGRKETGGKVEALILNARGGWGPAGEGRECEVLLRPARGCRVGSKLVFGGGRLKAEVTRIENGRRFLSLRYNGGLEELLEDFGEVPLPPYIRRGVSDSDKERYQTVFASKKGAIAAPTAGLHFTEGILSNAAEKGIDVGYVTLYVGCGTFRPVKIEDITRHKMEAEYFEIENKAAEKLRDKRDRIVAVGTTTCRVLETMSLAGMGHGWTDLFIYPPYEFKAVDALLTNFHLPGTTPLMLVSAFCGMELLFMAYKEAIKEGYRFYSYGDAMLIL